MEGEVRSSRSAAIFGAGPGLGASVARFLGGRGYHLTLISRDSDHLNDLADELRESGTSVSCHSGDIADPSSLDAILDLLAEESGTPDVAIYQTAGPSPKVDSPLKITAQNEREFVDALLFGPIHAAHRLVNEMVARGSGTVVMTLGSSALGPVGLMWQPGIAQAGLRNYLHSLSLAAEPLGVKVRSLIIGGLILNSNLQREWFPDADRGFPGALDPVDLARQIGDLMDGDEAEAVAPDAHR